MTGGEASGRGWLSRLMRVHISAEAITWTMIVLGVVLRLRDYLRDRAVYMDEFSLLKNLVGLSVLDFHTILKEYQLAPPGFLVLERLMVRLPFHTVMSARFFPLVCGIAALFLMRSVARRFLHPAAVPIAMGLFALSDWLIYYTAEIKQYSFDLLLTLVALLLAFDFGRDSPMTPRRLAYLAAFGVIGVWFSYPLTLVLAAIGSYLFFMALRRRDRRGAVALVGIGLAWVVSFAVCYLISHRILDKSRFIWDWWDFAFLRIPPRSMADLKNDFWQIVNVFDSPADVKMPLDLITTAMIALGLSVLGMISLFRRSPGGLYLLTAPWVFVLLASALHQYPFHGRLLIFLVPSVHLFVAQGALALTRRLGTPATIALGAFLLFQPVCDATWQALITPLDHTGFDSHGDLRHDLLDYLETLEKPEPGQKP